MVEILTNSFEGHDNKYYGFTISDKRKEDFRNLASVVKKNIKEKTTRVIKYTKHNILKLGEHFDVLNQKQFDELIDLDFERFVIDHPAIEGTFSPETELSGVRTMKRGNNRKEALKGFKTKLARQREGMAGCIIFSERCINFDNDIPKKKLMGMVEIFGHHYGFADNQMRAAEEIVDEYYNEREKVLDIRRKYPNNADLIKRLTGITIAAQNKPHVTVGAVSLNIYASKKDSAKIYHASSGNKLKNPNYCGFATHTRDANQIKYSVINRGLRHSLTGGYDPTGNNTRIHEEEHHKNKLLQKKFLILPRNSVPFFMNEYDDEKDTNIRKAILEDYFRVCRSYALECVKDEFNACLRGGSLQTVQIHLDSLFFTQGGTYDYLDWVRDDERRSGDQLYQRYAQKLLVDEYRSIIKNAVAAYSDLVRMGRISTNEATALLTDKPMTHWPKTVRRLLEQK